MAQVLFIDDDPFTLETLTRAAELLGHQALVANSGESGMRLAVEALPDLIFTDMQLPDTDGASLVCQLKEMAQTAHIPMFILSASPTMDAVERTREAGAEAYLQKPLRLQALIDLLEKYTAK